MEPSSAASIYAPFISLSRECRELYLPRRVAHIPASALSPLAFLRDFVSANLPLVITDGVAHWPATTRWRSDEYLRQRMEGREVTVALTPNGRADSLHADGRFVLPLEQRWPFASLLSRLSSGVSSKGSEEGVVYCQHQNDSFSREFSPLSDDVLLPLPFACLAFAAPPDAVNVWIGSADSVSSLHHDHYENVSSLSILSPTLSSHHLQPLTAAPLCGREQLYCVVRGVKQFLLYPPTDLFWLGEEEREVARWRRKQAEGGAAVWETETVEAAERVPWLDDVEAEMKELQRREDDDNSRLDAAAAADDGDERDDETDDGPLISRKLRMKHAKYDTQADAEQRSDVRHAANAACCSIAAASVSAVSPLYVSLSAGDVLYLPSLWFHAVSQRGDNDGSGPSAAPVIAVNSWYDMRHDAGFAYYQFMRGQVQTAYDRLRQRRQQRRDGRQQGQQQQPDASHR